MLKIFRKFQNFFKFFFQNGELLKKKKSSYIVYDAISPILKQCFGGILN